MRNSFYNIEDHLLILRSRNISRRLGILVLITCLRDLSAAQDTEYLKVHFLYGSRPKCEFRHDEKKWFGGKHGGHVGIESDSNMIVSFLPSGKYHVFENKRDRHSMYAVHSYDKFYSLFGGDPEKMKKAIFYIPVTNMQKQEFDRIARAYLIQTPYDYAFLGMRCAAAGYDMLAQLSVVPKFSKRKTFLKNFYPKKFRKKLFRLAEIHHWKIELQEGTDHRKWEKD